uniref:Mitochondrial protein n=1 Tax=Cannabis sativa TaxID=3483 RepID=A0A803NSX2_CANSA
MSSTSFLGTKPASTPMEPNSKLSKDTSDLLPDPTTYRSIIGKLIYLTITRPDLSFAVNKLNQFMTTPRTPHLQAAHRLTAYAASTLPDDTSLSKKILMLTGGLVLTLVAPSLATASSLVIELFLGSPKSSPLFLNPPPKLSTVQWPTPPVKSLG